MKSPGGISTIFIPIEFIIRPAPQVFGPSLLRDSWLVRHRMARRLAQVAGAQRGRVRVGCRLLSRCLLLWTRLLLRDSGQILVPPRRDGSNLQQSPPLPTMKHPTRDFFIVCPPLLLAGVTSTRHTSLRPNLSRRTSRNNHRAPRDTPPNTRRQSGVGQPFKGFVWMLRGFVGPEFPVNSAQIAKFAAGRTPRPRARVDWFLWVPAALATSRAEIGTRGSCDSGPTHGNCLSPRPCWTSLRSWRLMESHWTMFEQAFKNIDDVLWKEAGCTTELDYTEQTSWLLFLKYLDGLEQDKADRGRAGGEEVHLHPRQALPLGKLGRAQGQGRQARPQQGPDRRRPARLRQPEALPLPARLQAEGQRAEHHRVQDRRDLRRDQEQDSAAATTCARSSTTSTNCASARRPRSTSCRTSTKPRSRTWATPGATAASTTRRAR